MDKKLTVYYTSDVHGYYSPMDYATGKRTASGLANCMSGFSNAANTLIIDGGDILQGSPLTCYLYSKRKNGECAAAKLMNIAGYDFVTLGNHDFNYGKHEIEKYIGELNARCLCANVEGIANVEKTAVITLENGLKVGLTGATTHYVSMWEKPENLEGITVSDAFEAVKRALNELKSQGADITICIYHGGFENDVATGKKLSSTDENQGCRICEELDFDILLAGHQHMAAENAVINNTFTCQPADKAKQYIKMEVIVGEDKRVKAVSRLMDAGSKTHEAAERYIMPIEEDNAKWLDTPVGHLDIALLPSSHIDMAENGSYIANFFNQVQLDASGADISATSLANTVKGFNKDVTIRDIVSTYIFPNTLKTVLVERSILKKALERSAEYFSINNDGRLTVSGAFLKPIEQHFNFDYISGIDVTVDARRALGDRVISIKYNGCELEDGKMLKLCLNNYRASGAGGYDVYKSCQTVREQPTEIAEMIIEYVLSPVSITVDRTRWLKVIY